MALGLAQPLTEMSTRNISWGERPSQENLERWNITASNERDLRMGEWND